MPAVAVNHQYTTNIPLPTCADDNALWEQFWDNEFQPQHNSRLQHILKLMKEGTNARDTFLLDPFVQNTVRIFEQIQSRRVGAIVAGHKMGGKSQTLEFLTQFWKFHARTKGKKAYIVKLSFKTEIQKPPENYAQLFVIFNDCILKAGVVDACKSVVIHGGVAASKANTALDAILRSHKPRNYDITKNPAADSLPELAYRTLEVYKRILDNFPSGVSLYDLQTMLRCICYLFQRQDAQVHLVGPCVFVFDKVGELLDKNSALDANSRAVGEVVISMMNFLSEQSVATDHSNLFVIYSGSTSLANYISKQHLQGHVCMLGSFSGQQCQQLWDIWKGTLKCSEEKLLEAERWMSDVTPTTYPHTDSVLEFGHGLLDYSDGVAGCLVELFCAATGAETRPEQTLAYMVSQHFKALEASLTTRKGGQGAVHIRNLLAKKQWTDFADHGLAASSSVGPSAPVLRLLFSILRVEAGADQGPEYMTMLRSLAGLQLSGSFNGAVAQETLLWDFLIGTEIFCSRVCLADAKQTGSKANKAKKQKRPAKWQTEKSETFNDKPCGFVGYTREKTFAETLHVKSPEGGARATFLESIPKQLLIVPESQIFPSIDMSVAFFLKSKKIVKVFHVSASVDAKHFAASTASKVGHLPLKINESPPEYLRSNRAQAEVQDYRENLLTHSDFEGFDVEHWYAVFDEQATDLLNPTDPFDEPFYLLSRSPVPTMTSKTARANRKKS